MRTASAAILVTVFLGMLGWCRPVAAQLGEAPTPQDQTRMAAALKDMLAARLEFLEQAGFSLPEIAAVERAKGERVRLQTGLRQAASELAAAVQTPEADEAFVQQALDAYTAAKDATDIRMAELEAALIKQTGAEGDPKKMAALMLMGAVDNGLRVVCAVKSGTIGGAPTALDFRAQLAPTPQDVRQAMAEVLRERAAGAPR